MSITNQSANAVTQLSGEALLMMAIRNASNSGIRQRINRELERRASPSWFSARSDLGPIARIGGACRA